MSNYTIKNDIAYEYFSFNGSYDPRLDLIISAFDDDDVFSEISSKNNKNEKKSNEVLAVLTKKLDKNAFDTETGKKKNQILIMNRPGLSLKFYPDGASKDRTIAIEVEAGQAVCNYRFLKDFFEALTVENLQYLVIAVRNEYWGGKRKTPAHDFKTVCDFIRSWKISNRVNVKGLNGILIIGY